METSPTNSYLGQEKDIMSTITDNTASNKSVNLVQRFYAALAHGDTPGVLTLLHDNVHWTEAERFPYYSGTWVGPQAVHYNLLKRLAEDWEVFDAKADDFIVEGARVVSFGSYSGVYKKTGKSLLAPFAHLWAVQDEKIVSFRMYTDTAKVLDAMQ